NSEVTTTLLKDINPGRFFQSGYVNSLPYPPRWQEYSGDLSTVGFSILNQYLLLASFDERSPFFYMGNYSKSTDEAISDYNKIVGKINELTL
ncbi:hypothetical protein R0K04_23700, partial [Pseudoalteromonas sp. SIMBA_153]